MNNNKTFCEECRKDVEYKVEKVIINARLKNKMFDYVGNKAICAECGHEVYVPYIEDENLKALCYTYLQKSKLI